MGVSTKYDKKAKLEKKAKLVGDNEVSTATSTVVKEKKEKKEKKEQKEENDKKSKKEEKKTKRARDETEEDAAAEDAPAEKKKKRVKRDPSVEVDPFAVLETDPVGMTEDIKREARIKTQGFATRLVQGKEKNFEKDMQLKTIHLDSLERSIKTLTPDQRAALNLAVVSLKWKELTRHLQIFCVRPIAGMTMEQAKAAKKLAEKVRLQRRRAKYTAKYKKRMNEKMKNGQWDFSRPAKDSKKKKNPEPKAQVDKSKIEAAVAASAAPVSAVAQRINMAKEAAKARMKLASVGDDEE